MMQNCKTTVGNFLCEISKSKVTFCQLTFK
jgi:hypothetical protein